MTTRIRLLLPTLLLLLPVSGCAGTSTAAREGASFQQQGALTWAMTCNRCHRLRPPRQFSAEEWPVIVNHMRTRADLTKSEAEAVAAYLQRAAASGGGS